MVSTPLLHLLLASTAVAKPLRRHLTARSSQINWGPCDFESTGTLPIECAGLTVPLDYSNPRSSETLTLELLRSAAVDGPSKGSILFNFGGPGFETIHTLDTLAAELHNKTGGQHDLIGFNPRGLANTLKFSCFESPEERMVANTYKYPILALDAYDVALADSWANSQAISNICKAKHTSTGIAELVGTPFVVRDMMQIVDALKEDGLLRFWGFSYGSLLGETAAAMFPDRIDKLILDGVVNAFNYYNRLGIDVDQLLSADDAFRAVLSECLQAGPSKCALAADSPSSSPSDTSQLEAVLDKLAQTLRTSPITVNTTVISLRFVKDLLFITTKYTSDVPNALRHVHNLLHGQNLTSVVAYHNALSSGVIPTEDDATLAIKCGDTHPRASSLEDLLPDVDRMSETSDIFGDYVAGVVTVCGSWPFKNREMFDTGVLTLDGGRGPIKTKNPILFAGTTYDPVTPMHSARNMSAYFAGSVVLEQKGFGHSTLSQVSDCTNRITRSYFVNGTLPEGDTACEVDTTLF